jgi:hypothetical protein
MDSNEMIRRGFQADRVYWFYIDFNKKMVSCLDVTWDSEREINETVEYWEKRDKLKYQQVSFENFCYYHDLWGFTGYRRRY